MSAAFGRGRKGCTYGRTVGPFALWMLGHSLVRRNGSESALWRMRGGWFLEANMGGELRGQCKWWEFLHASSREASTFISQGARLGADQRIQPLSARTWDAQVGQSAFRVQALAGVAQTSRCVEIGPSCVDSYCPRIIISSFRDSYKAYLAA